MTLTHFKASTRPVCTHYGRGDGRDHIKRLDRSALKQLEKNRATLASRQAWLGNKFFKVLERRRPLGKRHSKFYSQKNLVFLSKKRKKIKVLEQHPPLGERRYKPFAAGKGRKDKS